MGNAAADLTFVTTEELVDELKKRFDLLVVFGYQRQTTGPEAGSTAGIMLNAGRGSIFARLGLIEAVRAGTHAELHATMRRDLDGEEPDGG